MGVATTVADNIIRPQKCILQKKAFFKMGFAGGRIQNEIYRLFLTKSARPCFAVDNFCIKTPILNHSLAVFLCGIDGRN